jgi:hypothetical protein
MLKPAPETASDETEIAPLPWFVTVKVCEFVLPTGTFPKLPLEGTTEIVFAFAIPFPDSVMSRAVENPRPVTTIFPVCAPALRGEKVTVNTLLLPRVRANGGVKPLAVK